MTRTVRDALRATLFGKDGLPAQEFTIGMVEPQSEIAVWLVGMGAPMDVTFRLSMACSEPLILSIAFDEASAPRARQDFNFALEYRRRDFPGVLLGRIRLVPADVEISVPGVKVVLFKTAASTNHCVHALRKLPFYSLYLYRHWKRAHASADVKMSFQEERAAIVTFIRPHPVFLGSVQWETGGNMFPMNLVGELGNRRISFALKGSRFPAHLIERLRRVAVANVPFRYGKIPYQLADNHKRESIEWNQLPFATMPSHTFSIPVPEFATRVRELLVEKIQRLGSHTLFLAQIVDDEKYSSEPELCTIHGMYQLWRTANGVGNLKTSIERDEANKQVQTVSSTMMMAAGTQTATHSQPKSIGQSPS